MKKVGLVLLMSIVIIGAIVYFLPAKTTNEKRVFTSKEIESLKEISINGNFVINMTTSDTEDIKCNFSKTKKGIVIGDTGLIESKIKNNILYINDENRKNMLCFGAGITETVTIYIPKSYENKLMVRSEFTKINIVNVNSKLIDCDVKDSDIAISLENIGGKVNVNSSLGDINLKLPKGQKFNLSVNSRLGEIDNQLSSNVDSSVTDKYINLTTLEGDIRISGN